nr:hypothetical protein [Tanacetum cinerariifolium]
MCKAYGGDPSVDLLRSFLNLGRVGLKTSWKYSPKRPVIYHRGQGIDDEFNFLPEEVHPFISSFPEASEKSKAVVKRKLTTDSLGEGSYHWAQKALFKRVRLLVMPQLLLMLIVIPIYLARDSCDAIRERKIKRDKAYAKMEKKCNEALQDLDKNPLVSYMRSEIEVLQGQVNGHKNEYGRLLLKEKKWANYEQTMSLLHAKIDGLEYERERLKDSEIQLLQEIDSLRHYMGISNLHTMCSHTNLSMCIPIVDVSGFASTHFMNQSTATTRNLPPPGAIGNGLTMSIPHCEKGHANVMDVIPCFGFLVVSQSYDFRHKRPYDLRYNVPSIILYNEAFICSFLAFCGSSGRYAVDLFGMFRESYRSQFAKSIRLLILVSFHVFDPLD